MSVPSLFLFLWKGLSGLSMHKKGTQFPFPGIKDPPSGQKASPFPVLGGTSPVPLRRACFLLEKNDPAEIREISVLPANEPHAIILTCNRF